METIHTAEYYVASLDLLGGKKMICSDINDEILNSIKNIYYSWITIKKEMFTHLQIKIFSDNIIVALKNDNDGNFDDLLEFISYMAEHFLKCGFKLRGGIVKGELFIDDMFVWGKALVNAYILENEIAVYPRIIIDEAVIDDIKPHAKDILLSQCDDSFYILNYLRSFGSNADGHLKIINEELNRLENECEDDIKIKEKNEWLKSFLLENKKYWEEYKNK